MTSLFKLYSLAFRSYTLCTSRESGEFNEHKHAHSTAIFPLVGIVLGTILSIFYKIMSFTLPEDIVDLLVIILIAIFSRGRYLIGFAAVIKSFFKTENRKGYLKANQGFLLILSQLFKYYALAQIPSVMKNAVIFLIPITSGWAMVQLCALAGWFLTTTNSQPDFTHLVTWKEFTIATCITFALFDLFLKLKGLVIIIIITLFSIIFIKLFQNQNRVFNENALGASNELTQPLFLICIWLLFGNFERN